MDNLHDFENRIPPITLEICKQGRLSPQDYRHKEIHACLIKAGYGDFGWANDGKVWEKLKSTEVKKIKFKTQFCNASGTQCLYVNHKRKVMYSVDMGD